jgi:hypothetical protein
VKKAEVTIPAEAAARLWETMQSLRAWELPDFSKAALDVPDYTVRLAWGGKTREIRVKGYTYSEKHLKLILAVEKCYKGGKAK